MAQRRMINKDEVLCDKFISLSRQAQVLFFFLSVMADDDGFISNLLMTMKMLRVTSKATEELVAAGYLHIFESGRALLMRWKVSNTIQKDRYTPSLYPEKSLIVENPDKTYSIKDVCEKAPSEKKNTTKSKAKEPPTLDEVKTYAEEHNLKVDVQKFYEHYSSNGWKDNSGKPINRWQSLLKRWEDTEFTIQNKTTEVSKEIPSVQPRPKRTRKRRGDDR